MQSLKFMAIDYAFFQKTKNYHFKETNAKSSTIFELKTAKPGFEENQLRLKLILLKLTLKKHQRKL
jgi:hypothetical protein